MRINKQELFSIPIIGYALHFLYALTRLPKNDSRIKELRRTIDHLKSREFTVHSTESDLRVPAETVSRVFNTLLGRAPDDNNEILGTSPLDFCLSVALSDERRLRVVEEIKQELSQENELQVTKTSLGFMVTHSDDTVIGNSLRSSGAGDESDIEIALNLIAKVSNPVKKSGFLEVGANIGTHGLRAFKEGFERVIAIEPDVTNFKLLRVNQILNGVEKDCFNFCAAVSDNDGAGYLELSNNNFGDHRVRSSVSVDVVGFYDETDRAVLETRLVRIDTLLAEGGFQAQDIGLVWMDIQGYEGHALAGSESLKLAKVPIVAEFWPYGLERSGGYQKLRQFLSIGARFYDLNQAKNKDAITSMSLDELDDLYVEMLKCETKNRAVFTDLLIIFDG